MPPIKATVRNGRIEPDAPFDLPEGTRLIVHQSDPIADAEAEWDDSPEGIEARESWLNSLEPLDFTPEEEQKIRVAMGEQRKWELEHAEEHANKLREMWQ